MPVKRVSAGEFEGRLVPTLEIKGRSVSDPTVENMHLGTAARLDAFSGREAERRRIEKRKRGGRAEEENVPARKERKMGERTTVRSSCIPLLYVHIWLLFC